ncbi:hypothetical protein D3C80_417530 [compost metagenome]
MRDGLTSILPLPLACSIRSNALPRTSVTRPISISIPSTDNSAITRSGLSPLAALPDKARFALPLRSKCAGFTRLPSITGATSSGDPRSIGRLLTLIWNASRSFSCPLRSMLPSTVMVLFCQTTLPSTAIFPELSTRRSFCTSMLCCVSPVLNRIVVFSSPMACVF